MGLADLPGSRSACSIGLHEIGHLLPAKRFGVKVTQYMVGFGPTLWSKHTAETEYGVKAVPLGGYIRMIGMYPPAKGADPTMLRASTTGRFKTLVDDARQQSMEEVRPEDADRVFYKLPVHQRIVVMLGGPTMNLLLAFVLFTIVLSVLGTPSLTTTVGRVVTCVPTSSNLSGAANSDGTVYAVDEAPAGSVGLRADDVILTFDGVPITTWEEQQAAIQRATPGETEVVVQRGQEQITLVVASRDDRLPACRTPPPARPPARSNDATSSASHPSTRWSPSRSARFRATCGAPRSGRCRPSSRCRRGWSISCVRPSRPRSAPATASSAPVGVGRLSGEVVAEDGLPMKEKAWYLLGFLAGLNLFLFLFNLIPLLPLDGGHVAGALWESVKRWWARVRHRPDPGPVDIAKALPVAYGVSSAWCSWVAWCSSPTS